jgi:hypothetical protein
MTQEHEIATLDLILWVTESQQGLRFRWTYSKDLFEEGTIKRMHGHFEICFPISSVDRTPG